MFSSLRTFAFAGVAFVYRPVQMDTDTEIDPRWDSQLRPQLLWVAEQLRPRRNQLPARLYNALLITKDDEERLNASDKTETELALYILSLLRKQCSGSFETFCRVLLETRDPTLCQVEKHLRRYGKRRLSESGESSTNGAVVVAQTSRARGNLCSEVRREFGVCVCKSKFSVGSGMSVTWRC